MRRIKWIALWLMLPVLTVQASLPGSKVGYVSEGSAFSNQVPEVIVYNDGYQENLIVFYKDPYSTLIHYSYAREMDERGLLDWKNTRIVPAQAMQATTRIYAKVLNNTLHLFGTKDSTALLRYLSHNHVNSFNGLLNENWGSPQDINVAFHVSHQIGIASHTTRKDGIMRFYFTAPQHQHWQTLKQLPFNTQNNPLTQDLPSTIIKPDKTGNQYFPATHYDFDYNNQHHMIYAQMYKKSGKANGIKFHKLDEGVDTFLYRLNGKNGKPKVETNSKPVALLKANSSLYLYYLDKDNRLMMTQTGLKHFYKGDGWLAPRAVLTLSDENPVGLSAVHYQGKNYIFYTNRDSGELRYTVEPVG